jgi:alkylation response protein AidB-like acyl-CoA dehydrogenase
MSEAPCHVIASGEQARSYKKSVTTLGRLAAIAEMTALSTAALSLAVDYAQLRHQFGRPIGGFQAVKHLLAEARAQVHGLESVLARCLTDLKVDPGHELAAAYLFAQGATEQVMDVALQVHGGIGYTMECPLSWLYLRAASLRGQWGTPDQLALALGRMVAGPASISGGE